MRRFLAGFSEPVWSGHVPSWADFITTTPELKFSVHTRTRAERAARHVRIALTGDFNALLLFFQGFEAATEHVVGITHDQEIAAQLGVPLLDPLPRHAVRTRHAIEARQGAERGNLGTQDVALLTRPKAEVEHDISPQLQAT